MRRVWPIERVAETINRSTFYSENLRETDHLTDLGIYKRIILKRILSWVWRCGLILTAKEQGPEAGSCEQGNKLLDV
jgi:hypothetical protein